MCRRTVLTMVTCSRGPPTVINGRAAVEADVGAAHLRGTTAVVVVGCLPPLLGERFEAMWRLERSGSARASVLTYVTGTARRLWRRPLCLGSPLGREELDGGRAERARAIISTREEYPFEKEVRIPIMLGVAENIASYVSGPSERMAGEETLTDQ